MNDTPSKIEKESQSRWRTSPDGVVAYHAALSRLRPGFKSRSGRHYWSLLRCLCLGQAWLLNIDVVQHYALFGGYPCFERAEPKPAAVVPLDSE